MLDTNIVIHSIQGTLSRVPEPGLSYDISTITELELLGTANLPADMEVARLRFIGDVTRLAIDDAVIRRAIEFRRGRNLRSPDAIIAATALHYNAIMLTNDADLLRAMGPMAQGVALVTGP